MEIISPRESFKTTHRPRCKSRMHLICRLDQQRFLQNVSLLFSFFCFGSFLVEPLENTETGQILWRHDFCVFDNAAYPYMSQSPDNGFIHAVILARKSLRATRFRTLEIFLAGMNPVVSSDMAGCGKCLSACRAFVSTFAFGLI